MEGKENDTADTARAATGAAMELAIAGRAFEVTVAIADAEQRFDLHGELDVERRRRGRHCGIWKKSPL